MKPIFALNTLLAVSLSFALPSLAQETTTETQTETTEAEAPAVPVTVDTVVARIGDHEITMGHVIVVRQQLPQQYAQLPDDVLFSGIVDQLVDQYLLSSQVDEADLALPLALRIENERRAILATSEIGRVIEAAVTEEDIQAAYDEAYGDVEPTQEYNASHILVETEEEAAELVTELEGGADFATLAQERSTGPSGPNGGELGWFGKGSMVPEFENEVISLEVGTVSAPVKTDFGWHVIRLNETRDVPPPALEQVQGELVGELNQKAIADRIAALRDETGTEVLIEGLPTDAFRDDSLLIE